MGRVRCKNFEILMIITLNVWTGCFDLGILILVHTGMVALLLILLEGFSYLRT